MAGAPTRWGLFAALVTLLAGCATGPGIGQKIGQNPDTTAPEAAPAVSQLEKVAFAAANTDAMGQSPANIHDGLNPVSDANPTLVWQDPATKRRLKVASFMSQASFDKYYAGVTGGTTTGAYSWVTLVPEIQAFCRATGLSGTDLTDRLEQRLGLNPATEYAVFVEMWVDRGDLFRPCPDPETSDTVCDLTFAQKDGLPVNPPVKGLADYLGWFEQTYQGSYLDGGAPWTRLGYTYDWNPATPKFGASEYLITADADYRVAGHYSADQYCAPAP